MIRSNENSLDEGSLLKHKFETEQPCLMENGYFTKEEEVRCVLMNALFRIGVDVWDCRPEFGKCHDPPMIYGMYLVQQTGDFPIFYNGRYYIVEVKFIKNSCALVKGEGSYKPMRHSPELMYAQSELVRKGGGLFVIVAEPTLYQAGVRPIETFFVKDCREQLITNFKLKLAENGAPYQVYIMDQQRYTQFLNRAGKRVVWSIYQRGKREVKRTRLKLEWLRAFAEDFKVSLFLRDFLNGKIGKKIVEILEV